jgi:hypothetical protein
MLLNEPYRPGLLSKDKNDRQTKNQFFGSISGPLQADPGVTAGGNTVSRYSLGYMSSWIFLAAALAGSLYAVIFLRM